MTKPSDVVYSLAHATVKSNQMENSAGGYLFDAEFLSHQQTQFESNPWADQVPTFPHSLQSP